jgi:alpha-beta hydrolase superfamily lysophospholipase
MSGPSRLALALLPALFLMLAACGGNADTVASPTPSADIPTPTSAPQAASPTAPDATVTPPVRVGDEPVGFMTEDGVTIRGHLYEPTGPRRKVVILAHMSSNDQRAWTAFAEELASQGVAAMTFDFRGYGETGGSRAVGQIDRDLDAAVRFIRSRDYTQVYLVGAEMGGTAALKVAARQEVAGIVSLSALTSFMGLDASADVAEVRRPKLFLASRDDADAARAVTFFMDNATGEKERELYDGRARGTDLLEGRTAEDVKRRIVALINR